MNKIKFFSLLNIAMFLTFFPAISHADNPDRVYSSEEMKTFCIAEYVEHETPTPQISERKSNTDLMVISTASGGILGFIVGGPIGGGAGIVLGLWVGGTINQESRISHEKKIRTDYVEARQKEIDTYLSNSKNVKTIDRCVAYRLEDQHKEQAEREDIKEVARSAGISLKEYD